MTTPPVTTPPQTAGPERKGDRTRAQILERAAGRATVVGLDGLSIGSLADDVGLSKGGVANHFVSKEQLQVATVAAAAQTMADRVLADLGPVEPGLPRLRAALDAWCDYLDDPPYEGGCFFCATTAGEVAPGEVRDALSAAVRAGLDVVREHVRLAIRLGELPADTDADQMVFELHAYLQEANWSRQFLGDEGAVDRARRAIRGRLES